MIKITEISPPRKVSGLSSFLITFDYKPQIVDIIKTLPTYYYHKKDYAWEIPDNLIAKALDILTYVDDIDLQLVPDDDEQYTVSLSDDEKSKYRIKPYEHQFDAINYGLIKKKWLLLDSMGVGKTNEIIWYAEALKRRGLIDHCMIICGVDSLRQNWKNEIQKFSTESCIVLGEKISKKGKISYDTVAKRAEQLLAPIKEFFVIVNITTIRSDAIVEAFKKSKNKFGMIALDECHHVATKNSDQGANLLKLAAEYKVAATGTLLTNNPMSCYVPLVWTENDHSILTMYKSQYCVFGGFKDSQVIGYKNLDLLREEIAACSIRRTLSDVRNDMPLKTITTEIIEMNDANKKFYDAIVNGVKEEADKIELKANNLLALTTRLRQATACPGILTSQDILSSKVERCIELVEDLVAQGEKVVILSCFKDPVYQLQKLLAQHKPLVATGDTDDITSFENMKKFQENPDYKVFIGTHGKLGTGFTLNAAAYMIMIDTPYTYASFSQSCDRIYRVNNTRPANIKVLICKDTIDERVQEIIEKKKDLADYVVDGKENSVSESLKTELYNIIKGL